MRSSKTRGNYPLPKIDTAVTKDSDALITSAAVYDAVNTNEERTERVIENLPTDIVATTESGIASIALYYDGELITGQTAATFNAAPTAHYIDDGSGITLTAGTDFTSDCFLRITKVVDDGVCTLVLGANTITMTTGAYIREGTSSLITLDNIGDSSYEAAVGTMTISAENTGVIIEIKQMTSVN